MVAGIRGISVTESTMKEQAQRPFALFKTCLHHGSNFNSFIDIDFYSHLNRVIYMTDSKTITLSDFVR